ncbi:MULTISPECIES: cation diffusion facilitator family transporter [Labilibaculum]|jgi:cobalt-zinc-cadmium efflux system protein|uniref:Cation transporter n=2 Tax=Labilibaculum TaxID=2060722 RepID=A0A2N3HTD3_9BACT|nr:MULTISPECIES: cation diffusion facilitator family transporter [Labilibaculum]MUP39604.1 cation diffusion facilitator family transporter [Labilibaculum euxinus]MVB08809.1 cation diffusion facilitator family transporter [Labilibaculum euxinus]PKQ61306.1 cation transporter [Labilibaculum filiforme]
MAHNHSHTHSHKSNYNKAFSIGVSLNILFVLVEVFYGLIANSSALLADAGHNASDVLSLIFAWFAIWLATKKPKGRFTYGFKKTTILISVLNAFLLFGAVIAIAWDAIGQFKNPEPVAGAQVMIVAGIGVLINTITALMFLKGQKDDLNIKGAFLHMAADAGVSLGVVISGLLIVKTGLNWIDPIMSFIIILVIMWSTWKLFIESIRLALDAVPKNIELDEVKSTILNQNGVEGLHDIHIWAMSTTENALSAHLIAPNSNPDQLLKDIQDILSKKYNINHLTLQIEKEDIQLNCKEC